MANEDDNLVYLGVGVIGAILLGTALTPLRDFTTASNSTFPFMALTIAIGRLDVPRPRAPRRAARCATWGASRARCSLATAVPSIP